MNPADSTSNDDLNASQITVAELNHILKLEAAIVHPQDDLLEVARVMLQHPKVNVACVVNQEGELVGLLSLQDLANGFFIHVFPVEFLGQAHDLKQALEFAQMNAVHTAGDAMSEPVSVRQDDTVKQAFDRMHRYRLAGIPIVDDGKRVLGFINLLELLAIYTGAA